MADATAAANHRLAPRMAALAFLSQNIALGSVYGSFSVLMTAVEARYGVSRQGSSLALPLMSAALAVSAPIAGVLAERVSTRLLMIIGSLLSASGYAILALSNSHAVYLMVYALLFGPAICLSGVVVPSALVTRWFAVNRGKALGIVHMPLLMGPLAMASALLLRTWGLPGIYAALCGLALVNLVVALFAIDFPPAQANAPASETAARLQVPTIPVGSLLVDGNFWRITIAFAANVGATVMMGAHLVPMVTGWGIAPALAASLVLASSLAGMVGTPALGWVADRLGARATMMLICLDCAALWALLLLQPSYPALVVIAFALGFHGGATMAVFTNAVSEYFGPAAFSRVFGFSKMLPVTLLAVPAAAAIYVRTGSYVAAIMVQAGLLLIGGLVVALGGRRGRPASAALA